MRASIFACAAALAVLSPHLVRADVVTDWNLRAVNQIRTRGLGPNPATRVLAIAHIAAYEAVNSIDKAHEPYHELLPVVTPASPDAAALSALHTSLVLLFPNDKNALDAVYATDLAKLPAGDATDHGLALGETAAVDIFVSRLGDGSEATEAYPGGTDAGVWRPTPRAAGASDPTPLAASQPWWRKVKPFGLTSPDQFRPPAPPAITSNAFTTAYLETKALGALTGSTRTADQTEIAKFWAQATHVPFNAILRSISAAKGLGLSENARAFALLAITLADTRIAVWDAKYTYGYWRPITAINWTTDYGNAGAIPDAAWVPLLETPNHPEYPSGHSTTGGGGGRVLAALFGTDTVDFAVGSDTLAGTVRGFSSFTQAEQENADSRVYGGIHYRFSNDTGLDLGHEVAAYVLQNYLLPAATGGSGGAGGSGGEAGETGTAGDGGAGTGGVATGGTGGGDAGTAGASAGDGGASAGTAGSASGGTAGNASGGTAGAAAGGTAGSASGAAGSASGAAGSASGTAGASTAPASDDSGCSCAAAGAQGSAMPGAALAAFGVAWLVSRRRRRSA